MITELEFKSLALLYAGRLLDRDLPANAKRALASDLFSWRDLNVDSTNWAAMRARSHSLR